MTRSKKRRPSDMDPGGRRNPYPQKKDRQGTDPPSRPGRRLDSNTPSGPRESRDYNHSRNCNDRRSPQGGLADTYRPRPGGDSYRPRPAHRPRPAGDSYRPDSSRFANSRSATNQPVASRAKDSVRPRSRSPLRRYRQQGTSDQGGIGRVTRQPLPDRQDGNGIPGDARSWSPRPQDRANGPAGSQRSRDGSSRSQLPAGKGAAIEVRRGPPSSNNRAHDPSESSLAHTRDSSKFNPTKDSPTLQQGCHDLGQPTKEPRSLGENNSVTGSAGSQPDTNVPHPGGREGSPEDTSYSSDLRSSSRHSLCSQREGTSSRLGESGVPQVLRYEIPIPKLEPDDFLPESTSADRGLYLKAGTPSEICVWKPDSAPKPDLNDSAWRTTNFTPSIWELVHGRARQAKNRASAARLPDNVPLFGPRIKASSDGRPRSRKAKFRGSLEEYYRMLSDKEKGQHGDDPTLPTGPREDDDPAFSSSSEEEEYDLTSLKDPRVFGRGLLQPKSQWGTPPKSEAQTGSKNGLPTKDTLCAGGVPGDSIHNTRPIEAMRDPAPSKTPQEENPSKSGPQAGSEHDPLTKDTLGTSGVPNGSSYSIAPTKKLAIARGKQLRPELVQAMALLRTSTSQPVHQERACGEGHLPLTPEGPLVTGLGISGCTGDENGVPDAPSE